MRSSRASCVWFIRMKPVAWPADASRISCTTCTRDSILQRLPQRWIDAGERRTPPLLSLASRLFFCRGAPKARQGCGRAGRGEAPLSLQHTHAHTLSLLAQMRQLWHPVSCTRRTSASEMRASSTGRPALRHSHQACGSGRRQTSGQGGRAACGVAVLWGAHGGGAVAPATTTAQLAGRVAARRRQVAW